MKLNKNQYTIRKTSILTDGEVEELYVLKDFPVFIGMGEISSQRNDYTHDMAFDICKETGIIQLRYLIDLDIIYSKYHSEAIGNWWAIHHKRFSEIILKYQNNNTILEIGGSDSKLISTIFKEKNNIKSWTILEPTIKNRLTISKVNYVEDFFGPEFFFNNSFDMIIHSNTFEHMYDPVNFLKLISSTLKKGNYHIFSVPNLYSFLKNKFINTLNFEHTMFLTEEIIDNLLNIYGFQIIEKYYYNEDSIFYVTKKEETIKLPLKNNYEKYKKMYLDLINFYKVFIEDLNKKLENTQKDVYVFGGHIFTQFLICMGLNIDKIKFILDNSPIKNEKRLYGTNLIIKSPNDVELNENSLVILKVGQYRDEIISQLLNINPHLEIYE